MMNILKIKIYIYVYIYIYMYTMQHLGVWLGWGVRSLVLVSKIAKLTL